MEFQMSSIQDPDARPGDNDIAQQVDHAIVTKKYSYGSIFRFASAWDALLIIVGTVCALVNGATLPFMPIVFGDIMQAFITYDGTFESREQIEKDVRIGVINMCLIGVISFVTSYIQMTSWTIIGENISNRIREQYFRALMRQDVGWFDKSSTGELTARMVSDVSKVQEGISDKIGLLIQFTSSFVTGFIIAYVKGPKLAGVLTSAFPVLAGAGYIMSTVVASGSSSQQDSYAGAGSIAQQTISSIRTVVAFGGEEREAQRYAKHLDMAEKAGLKKALLNGVGVGSIQFVMYCVYSLAFWYGNIVVNNREMNAGQVLSVFFSILIGAFSLGNASPHISVIGNAQGAAQKLFETIDRVSSIDPLSESGEKLQQVQGNIEFKNIDFHYPSRPDVPILKNFSLKVEAGKTVALVGMSGSGKSTIVKLVERFYDPLHGSVTLDGVEVKDLNVAWLRQQVGIVSQEPILFNTTIRQNLMYGFKDDGSSFSKEEIDAQIEQCCRKANAWDFIEKLPYGLDSTVGESGSMLSGGQKQRIAIARSIMKNPQILLLDEATSALDTESERIVQAALDAASQNRTTIIIAHRLSTVKNADVIVVMKEGEIVEMGNHDSLLKANGIYHELVQAQHLKQNLTQESSSTSELAKSNVSPPSKAPSPVNDSSNFVVVKVDPSSETTEISLESNREKSRHTPDNVQLGRILKLNTPEYLMMVIAALGAMGNGAAMPLFSILFTNILTALGTDKANFWALMFFIFSIGAFVCNFLQIGFFNYTGERLTRRLREKYFRALLRQEIGYFDLPENSTGSVCAKLAEDASLVQGLTGPMFGAIIQGAAGCVVGLTIAFMATWQLTLVLLGIIPLIGFAGYIEMQSLVGYGSKSRAAYEAASQVACEAIGSIRTVSTLTQEKTFIKKFEKDILIPHRVTIRGSFVTGLCYAISQAMLYFAFGIAFLYGAFLISRGLYNSEAILNATFSIIFTAMETGHINNFTPDAAKAKIAAASVFSLLDRESNIDVTKEEGEKRVSCNGSGTFNSVKFSYPSRPDQEILKGLVFDFQPGTTVALVGRSGCGKSTVMGLLERWYDVTSGSVSCDGLDVRKWNLTSLRSIMAMVGQEPVLFNVSIRENIAYGAKNKEALDDDIVGAAKLANIHEFIVSLPDGYETLVGEKGGQISGGQKQRIAIARALIRNPRLLLLDEATSALDSESEKVVQEALDKAAAGRTTIVIAHRLSTIQNADKILFVEGGRVIESGTHFELVETKGEYRRLVDQQALYKSA